MIRHEGRRISAVRNSIAVRVGIARVRPPLELGEVRQPVIIRVFTRIVAQRVEVVRDFKCVRHPVAVRVRAQRQQFHRDWGERERLSERRLVGRDERDDGRRPVRRHHDERARVGRARGDLRRLEPIDEETEEGRAQARLIARVHRQPLAGERRDSVGRRHAEEGGRREHERHAVGRHRDPAHVLPRVARSVGEPGQESVRVSHPGQQRTGQCDAQLLVRVGQRHSERIRHAGVAGHRHAVRRSRGRVEGFVEIKREGI